MVNNMDDLLSVCVLERLCNMQIETAELHLFNIMLYNLKWAFVDSVVL